MMRIFLILVLIFCTQVKFGNSNARHWQYRSEPENGRAQFRRPINGNRRQSSVDDYRFDRYLTYCEINRFIHDLQKENPDRVKIEKIATTEESRYVYKVKVSDNSVRGPKTKIWIEGGIHAREWISPAVTLFLLKSAAMGTLKDLNNIEWYFVLLANPDGYAYTFTNETGARNWRKNRRIKKNSNCRGVDLNRNWNVSEIQSQDTNPCNETYFGPSFFSERETIGLQKAMESALPLNVVITFHSFGQIVFYPFRNRNQDKLIELGNIFVNSVASMYNYTLKGASKVGATDDYAYDSLKVPYVYTIELPPEEGTAQSFELPASEILKVSSSVAVGIFRMVEHLDK